MQHGRPNVKQSIADSLKSTVMAISVITNAEAPLARLREGGSFSWVVAVD